jgi:SAM-dependent methyltransferase
MVRIPTAEIPSTRPASTEYDSVSYPGRPYRHSHPDRLAVVASLLGVAAPDVERCRVLELGCGDGGNLIPMALTLPGSRFVGYDLAAEPIGEGRARVTELGLSNITLEARDIASLGDDLGEFDYVISHGVYSWVPEQVRDRILEIAGHHLATNGIAYVSYATYPGCLIRQLVRDMMLFHVQSTARTIDQVEHAISFVRFVQENQSEPSMLGTVLKHEIDRLARLNPAVLFHDDLADVNAPLYFGEFAEHAARHGLQFLGESSFSFFQESLVTRDAQRMVRELAGGNVLVEQQYFDFLKCRPFRQSVLCRNNVAIDRSRVLERIRNLHVACSLRPISSDADPIATSPAKFRSSDGAEFTTDLPLTKSALMALGSAWPGALSLPHLFEKVIDTAKLVHSGETERERDFTALADFLLRICSINLGDFFVRPPRFALSASERPRASPLARAQNRTSGVVTTLTHQSTRVEDAASRHLLSLLDGSRTHEALRLEMQAFFRQTEGPDFVLPGEELESVLSRVAEQALLVD